MGAETPATKEMKMQNNNKLKVFGTKEWAEKTANCLMGCKHNCLYCYAKSMAIRFKRATAKTWATEKPAAQGIDKVCRGKKCKVMFPSTHDITPRTLSACLAAINRMLVYGHELLIVSKPHHGCIKVICKANEQFKDHILFRFTIGSRDNKTLKFWEPNAPDFNERLKALKFAYGQDFKTSVSCEPMLDDNIAAVVDAVSPYITDAIWIGKANRLIGQLKINGQNKHESHEKSTATGGMAVR
jgi:DNA repair photolyase